MIRLTLSDPGRYYYAGCFKHPKYKGIRRPLNEKEIFISWDEVSG